MEAPSNPEQNPSFSGNEMADVGPEREVQPVTQDKKWEYLAPDIQEARDEEETVHPNIEFDRLRIRNEISEAGLELNQDTVSGILYGIKKVVDHQEANFEIREGMPPDYEPRLHLRKYINALRDYIPEEYKK